MFLNFHIRQFLGLSISLPRYLNVTHGKHAFASGFLTHDIVAVRRAENAVQLA